MINKGDAFPCYLNFKVNGIPLEEFEADEIEVYFGNARFLLSDGTLKIDEETGKYYFFLNQTDTFDFGGYVGYQIRVRKGNEVNSPNIKNVFIGDSISREII